MFEQGQPVLDMTTNTSNLNQTPADLWKKCEYCKENFKSVGNFCRHLRDFHCTKEGGSFTCRFGRNGVCQSLPVDGVSDLDYEDHIVKDHAKPSMGNRLWTDFLIEVNQGRKIYPCRTETCDLWTTKLLPSN